MSRGDESVAPTLLQSGDRALTQGGMTLREHFAGLALQGLLAQMRDGWNSIPAEEYSVMVAEEAVTAADALLAELAKPPASVTEADQAELRG